MCFLCSTEKNKQCFVYLYIFVSESKCVGGGFLEEDTHEQEVMTILKGRSFGFLSLVLQ